MCQRRPADPTDPGDAADLSIMGYRFGVAGLLSPARPSRCFLIGTVAQERLKINSFLTNATESRGLR